MADAIAKIEENKNDWINILNSCSGLKERYEKLTELLPETSFWPCIVARELVFHIQYKFQIDLGVCEHYRVNDYYQYCLFDGQKTECLCAIPQPRCVFRDQNLNGLPKYPELMPVHQ